MDGSALLHHRAATSSRKRSVAGQRMGDVLGYARVSTGDQNVAGQTMRLEQAGAIKVFTDVRSGKSMDRPGLAELFAYAKKATRSPWSASTGSGARWRNCSPRSLPSKNAGSLC